MISKLRRRSAVLAAALLLAASLSAALSSVAGATPWDPHVALTGTADCGVIPNGKITGLWLWTPEDGGQWFGYSGHNYRESFRRDYWHVPTGGTTVQYDLYCSGSKMHGSFGLQRPAAGTYTTRNIYFRF
jgi:hypothetical protein